eukprot:4253008-Amphidinium_carterae.1
MESVICFLQDSRGCQRESEPDLIPPSSASADRGSTGVSPWRTCSSASLDAPCNTCRCTCGESTELARVVLVAPGAIMKGEISRIWPAGGSEFQVS